jgi:hypothetical protein
MYKLITFALAAVCLAASARAADAGLDTARIEQLTGVKGQMNEKEGVFKVSVPRDDLRVTAAGVRMTPPMGLTSWTAFKQVGDHAVVMGDNVVLEDQVNAVMDAALQNGLEVTALHNHFFWDQPKVMFMHVGGMGDPEQLASAVGKVFAAIKQTSGGNRSAVPMAEIDPAASRLDTQKIEQAVGHKGELGKGVFKITIAKTMKMHGQEMGSAMGVNT